MESHDLQQFFEFAREIGKLKQLERFKGHHYWKDYPELPRYESVADHTWRLGMLVLMFADQLTRKIDLEKALKMVLIHDLPEIIAGDESPIGDDGTGKKTHAYDPGIAQEKHLKEKEAATALFGMLPKAQAEALFEIWLEYEQQKSFESRVIKALDKIEALMQVLEYREGHLFEKHLEFTISYALKDA